MLPLWASLLSSLTALGCLDEAPEYPPRAQIPPFIISAQVTPALSEVYEDGLPMRINVPFRSEDVNEDVSWRFYSDLVPGATSFIFENGDTIVASTYDDTGRSVSYDWRNQNGRLPGCHSLTLVLTYENNLDARGLPIDESRANRVVWWIDLDDPQGTTLIRSCPRAN
jgi:hypothetical protein